MKGIVLIIMDLKNILRDPSLWIIMVLPPLLAVLLRTVPPLYEPYIPEAAIYRPVILAFFTLLSSIMAGFLMAFVMLDEKDQELFPVYDVTPLRFRGLLKNRITTMTILGFLFAWIVSGFSGLIEISPGQLFLLSSACSLAAPLNTLFIVAFAGNKIEGVTYYKIINILTLLPVLGLFIPGKMSYIFGIIPYYWIYRACMSNQGSVPFLLYLGIGLLMQGLYLIGVYRLFLWKHRV